MSLKGRERRAEKRRETERASLVVRFHEGKSDRLTKGDIEGAGRVPEGADGGPEGVVTVTKDAHSCLELPLGPAGKQDVNTKCSRCTSCPRGLWLQPRGPEAHVSPKCLGETVFTFGLIY